MKWYFCSNYDCFTQLLKKTMTENAGLAHLPNVAEIRLDTTITHKY